MQARGVWILMLLLAGGMLLAADSPREEWSYFYGNARVSLEEDSSLAAVLLSSTLPDERQQIINFVIDSI